MSPRSRTRPIATSTDCRYRQRSASDKEAPGRRRPRPSISSTVAHYDGPPYEGCGRERRTRSLYSPCFSLADPCRRTPAIRITLYTRSALPGALLMLDALHRGPRDRLNGTSAGGPLPRTGTGTGVGGGPAASGMYYGRARPSDDERHLFWGFGTVHMHRVVLRSGRVFEEIGPAVKGPRRAPSLRDT